MTIEFQQVRDFLTSWGMHFDTPEKDSTTIPYPQVYGRMRADVGNVWASPVDIREMLRFISRITDTTDGQTYLVVDSWDEMENFFDSF